MHPKEGYSAEDLGVAPRSVSAPLEQPRGSYDVRFPLPLQICLLPDQGQHTRYLGMAQR